MNFASDNTSPVAPEILDALNEAAQTAAPAYGDDPWTAQLDAQFSALFETEVLVFPIAVGTAANALALSQLSPPFGAIYCHTLAHSHEHQCGAPELYTGGAKLIALDGDDAKLDAAGLASELARSGRPGDHHRVIPAAVSLTQATEQGTVYRQEEIAAIVEVARGHTLAIHMDGARFANAVAALDCSPAAVTWRAGVDVLAFGATKNGALAAEAVIFFDPAAADRFRYRQKRGGHLLSKMRFVSAQLLAALEHDRWLTWARHANAMATRLAHGLEGVPGVRLLHPVSTNMVWCTLPEQAAGALDDAGITVHVWQQDGETATRLVCAWDTRAEIVDRLVSVVEAAAAAQPARCS